MSLKLIIIVLEDNLKYDVLVRIVRVYPREVDTLLMT